MALYRENEFDRFYEKNKLRKPLNIPQFDKMIVHPSNVHNQPMLSRLFNARNITLIYGRANCGKTPLICSMAVALSSGCDLDGIHTMCPEPQSCLIVSGEMNDAQWGKIEGWNKKMFQNRCETAFVEIANYPFKLDTDEGQQHFEDLVRRVNASHQNQKKVSVLIFDSVKTLTMAGDNPSKWNTFFDFLNKLREDHGWTIIVIHHTHKGKDDGSFGTYNIDIKVDNKIYVGKDFAIACDKLGGAERWLPPEDEKDQTNAYFSYVKYKTNEKLSGRYADSIWFYLVLEKGRDFKPSEKLPVLMRMLPEDEHPEWYASDILHDESPWSYKNFRSSSNADSPDSMRDENKKADCSTNSSNVDTGNEDKKPTYKELLASRDREFVLKWLRKGYAEGHKTRAKLAQWLGCEKSDIDNLMSNDYYDHIVATDLKG